MLRREDDPGPAIKATTRPNLQEFLPTQAWSGIPARSVPNRSRSLFPHTPITAESKKRPGGSRRNPHLRASLLLFSQTLRHKLFAQLNFWGPRPSPKISLRSMARAHHSSSMPIQFCKASAIPARNHAFAKNPRLYLPMLTHKFRTSTHALKSSAHGPVKACMLTLSLNRGPNTTCADF